MINLERVERMYNHNHQSQEVQDHIQVSHDHKPYWDTVHHTLGFWIFLFLMFVGISYYIMSVDFAFAPYRSLKQPLENNKTR
jgi:hypothetical protein